MNNTTLSVKVALTKNADGTDKVKPFFHILADEIFIPQSNQDHARPLIIFSNKNRKVTHTIICLPDRIILDDGKSRKTIML